MNYVIHEIERRNRNTSWWAILFGLLVAFGITTYFAVIHNDYWILAAFAGGLVMGLPTFSKLAFWYFNHHIEQYREHVPVQSFIDKAERVENKDRRFGSQRYYFPCYVRDGYQSSMHHPALFTKDQIEEAIARALRNPEDIDQAVTFWMDIMAKGNHNA